MVSQKLWDSLDDTQKAAFEKAGDAAVVAMRGYVDNVEAQGVEALKAQGMQVNTLTPEDKQAFQDKLADVYVDYQKQFGKELMDSIIAINERCGYLCGRRRPSRAERWFVTANAAVVVAALAVGWWLECQPALSGPAIRCLGQMKSRAMHDDLDGVSVPGWPCARARMWPLAACKVRCPRASHGRCAWRCWRCCWSSFW